MKYGISEEYPHLGATPDGIVPDGRIIEVKCLKVLKENTVEDVVSGKQVPPPRNLTALDIENC